MELHGKGEGENVSQWKRGKSEDSLEVLGDERRSYTWSIRVLGRVTIALQRIETITRLVCFVPSSRIHARQAAKRT